MDILQVPTTNYWQGHAGYSVRWLILHGTAGGTNAREIAQQFIDSQGTSNPKSVHYVIDQAGQVVQCVQESDSAWGNGVPERGCDPWWSHALNPNYVTISIEHVKDDVTNAVALTDAQKAASFALVRDICSRNNIPMRKADKNGGITGHFSISPLDRARCPGTYPWQDLFTYLQGDDMLQITDAFASTYFKQTDPNHWLCNNGYYIADGLLHFYRQTGGVLRLPKGNEQYTIPGVAWQEFEAGIAVYDPQNKLDAFHNPYAPCYLVKLDSPLAQQLLGVANLQTKITVLENQLDAAQKQGSNDATLQTQLNAATQALANEKTANASLQVSLTKAQADAQSAVAAAAQLVATKNTAETQAADYQSQVIALKQQIAELQAKTPSKENLIAEILQGLEDAVKKL